MQPQLTNLTFYAQDIARLRDFYGGVLGLPIRFQEGDHIACVSAAPGLTICAHDTSEGPDGASEFIFAADDHGLYEQRARSLGFEARAGTFSTGEARLDLSDPHGNLVRLQPKSVYSFDEWVRELVEFTLEMGYSTQQLSVLIDSVADARKR